MRRDETVAEQAARHRAANAAIPEATKRAAAADVVEAEYRRWVQEIAGLYRVERLDGGNIRFTVKDSRLVTLSRDDAVLLAKALTDLAATHAEDERA